MNKLPEVTWQGAPRRDRSQKTDVVLPEVTWQGAPSNRRRDQQTDVILPEVTWQGVPSSRRSDQQSVRLQNEQWSELSVMDREQPSVQLQNEQWSELSGVMPPISIHQFKGVNVAFDSFSIDPSYATNMKNLTAAEFPSLTVRPDLTVAGTGLPLTAFVRGLGVWKDTELHVIVGGVWKKLVAGVWSADLDTGLSTTAFWSFCNFQGNLTEINLIGANGVEVLRYNGTTVQALSGAPAGLKYIDQHDNRLYGAVGNSLFFSAISSATDWSTVDDSGEILVETMDGELINGIKAGFHHLLIFKPSSVYELWGTEPLNYELKPVATDIGLLNNQCITVLNGIPYWMDRNGIYMYGGARPRKDFSLPVKSYIENMGSGSDLCSMGNDGRNLYVSIPSVGSSVPDMVLEYNPDFGTWYVYKDVSPLQFAKMGDSVYMGDITGNVLNLDMANVSNAVSWEWVSVPFGSGSRAQKVQWYRMWYMVDLPTGSSMDVYLSPSAEGDSDWELVKTVEASDTHSGRIIIPVETVANANWVRVKFSGVGPMKITEFDYQQRGLPMY